MTKPEGHGKKRIRGNPQMATKSLLILAVACLSHWVISLQSPSINKRLSSTPDFSDQETLSARQIAAVQERAEQPLFETPVVQGSDGLTEKVLVSDMHLQEVGAETPESGPSAQVAAEKEKGQRQADTAAGVQLKGSLLSVDVTDVSPVQLFKDLGRKCHVDIVSPEVLGDKSISASFRNRKLGDGIRTLLRISGVGNYAVVYQSDIPDESSVSQIFFFPESSEGGEGPGPEGPTGIKSPLQGPVPKEGSQKPPTGSWT